MSLQKGTLLCGGMYRVEDVLGQGGFGITYRAVQVALNRTVCVKEFFLADDNVRDSDGRTVSVLPSTTTRDRKQLFEAYKTKFSHEAQRQASLDGNDHIVRVYNLWEENGTAYFAMEYIEGRSLDALVPMGQQMPFAELLDFTNQMLDVLEFIHDRGIYHLDIKPGNIMMTGDGVVKLVDFGASKCVTVHSGGGTTNLMPLTEGYAPIEQAEFEIDKIGPWTDLYALGATIYRLATGRRPPSRNAILDAGDDAFRWDGQLFQVQGMVTELMRYNRKDRPQSAAAARTICNTAREEDCPDMPAWYDDVEYKDFEPHRDAEPTHFAEETEPALSTEETEPVAKAKPQPVVKRLPDEQKNYSRGWYLLLLPAILIVFIIVVLAHFNTISETDDSITNVHFKKYEDVSTGNRIYRDFKNGVSFTMVPVKGGTFTMGATAEQGSNVDDDEKPAHRVTVSDYYIGQTEVTEGLWRAVMGSNPSYIKKGDNYPVENVSWEDCQTFISKLNSLTGEAFRLPTEAEWEFAARGGTASKGYKYSGGNTFSDVAWYSGNSGIAKQPVATKAANELGLYDMSGNVWEWCQDWYGSYSGSAQTNPTGPTTGSGRVNRGGSWDYYAGSCRVSNRGNSTPSNRYSFLGLRLAR